MDPSGRLRIWLFIFGDQTSKALRGVRGEGKGFGAFLDDVEQS